jgi:hypothetical protein
LTMFKLLSKTSTCPKRKFVAYRNLPAGVVTSGEFRGQVRNTDGDPLTIAGLWGLRFPTTSLNVTDPNALYFTAGIIKEADGLFGTLTPNPQKDTEK